MQTAAADTCFVWSVRVYYEDTDAGGVVYYANYLKFFERCRTEWLRALGLDQAELAERDGLLFVVAGLSVDYRRPARLDDRLAIEARVEQLARSYLVFAQRALRAGEVLATARVKVACVDARRRAPTRLPDAITSRIAVSATACPTAVS